MLRSADRKIKKINNTSRCAGMQATSLCFLGNKHMQYVFWKCVLGLRADSHGRFQRNAKIDLLSKRNSHLTASVMFAGIARRGHGYAKLHTNTHRQPKLNNDICLVFSFVLNRIFPGLCRCKVKRACYLSSGNLCVTLAK